MLNSVLEKVRELLPAHMENELGKINMQDIDAQKAEFESLAHRACVDVKAGSRFSDVIKSQCGATAILNMIGYSFDRDENRLSQMDANEKWQFEYLGNVWLAAESPLK